MGPPPPVSEESVSDGGAIDGFALAMEQTLREGKGWKSPADREAYLKKITDDDAPLPALFCSSQSDLEQLPDMAEAFSQLLLENETPVTMMHKAKGKGNEAFATGQRNEAKNIQYYRQAINDYNEALAWAEKVVAVEIDGAADAADADAAAAAAAAAVVVVPAETTPPPPPPTPPPSEPTRTPAITAAPAAPAPDSKLSYTSGELALYKSVLFSNRAMAHMEIKNWGFVIQSSTLSLTLNPSNVKAYYRLAKAHEARREWELCLDACTAGLAADPSSAVLQKLLNSVSKNALHERSQRQTFERDRAERVGDVKALYKWCKSRNVSLGRVPLVEGVCEDDDYYGDSGGREVEKRWNFHQPHSGKMPSVGKDGNSNDYTWPAMFLYPAVGQSDFVDAFAGGELLAERLADMFPEEAGSRVAWDHDGSYVCSSLAVYFEVHGGGRFGEAPHPEDVSAIKDMGACMRFFEHARALKGCDGLKAGDAARDAERKELRDARKRWEKEKGKWASPQLCDVVRVHPAATFDQCLTHKLMLVPNFLVTFIIFPEEHPAHKQFLKERKVVTVLNPIFT